MNGPYIFLSNLQDSKIPTYQRMWSFMESTKPGVFAQGNAEGLERVKKGNRKYAFLMESTTIEYVIERECDTTQIGGLLDSKGYGIALPPGMYIHSTNIVVCVRESTKPILCRKTGVFLLFSIHHGLSAKKS